MAIVTADKIFIDPKEEITFILEKVLDSEKDKIILIVPQNSVLFTSNISVNILFDQLLNSKKIMVMVTEDEFGSYISTKAGFVVKNKVSEVDVESWNLAQQNKMTKLESKEEKKAELLENIIGEEKANEAKDEVEIEQNEEDLAVDNSDLEDVSINKQQPMDEIAKDSGFSKEKVKSDEVSLEDALEKYKKPRQTPKVVDLDGLQVFAGGDIRNNSNNSEKDVKIDSVTNFDDMNTEKDQPASTTRTIKPVNSGSFTGRDFTKSVRPKDSIWDKLSSKFSRKRRVQELDSLQFEEQNKQREKRKKIILLTIILLVVLFSGGTYVLASSMSSIDISLTLKKQEINFSEKVIADVNLTEIDIQNISIPARLLEEDNLSMSRTGEANGRSKTGTKAKGFVNIYNTTSTTISIKAGTKITSVATGLKYQITKDVTVNATETELLQEATEAGIADDVPVEAVDFGEEYNIDDSVSNTVFEIEGFNGVDSVYAKRFNNFEGGEAVEFDSVSKENIENLKKLMLPDLEKQGRTKLEAFLPSGYVIIEETIKFEETKVTSLPEQDKESKDKTFNLTLEGKISALAIRESDLQDLVENLLNQSSDDEENQGVVLEQMGGFIYKDVVRDGDKASFTVSIEAEAKLQLSEDKVKSEISGMKIEEAKDYLESLDQVEDAKVRFNPNFIPESLQRVPKDSTSIKISTK